MEHEIASWKAKYWSITRTALYTNAKSKSQVPKVREEKWVSAGNGWKRRPSLRQTPYEALCGSYKQCWMSVFSEVSMDKQTISIDTVKSSWTKLKRPGQHFKKPKVGRIAATDQERGSMVVVLRLPVSVFVIVGMHNACAKVANMKFFFPLWWHWRHFCSLGTYTIPDPLRDGQLTYDYDSILQYYLDGKRISVGNPPPQVRALTYYLRACSTFQGG